MMGGGGVLRIVPQHENIYQDRMMMIMTMKRKTTVSGHAVNNFLLVANI
jgi:hypothetical protein